MKLLQKANRYYLIFSVVIFLLAGLILYVILIIINKNEMDEKLRETKVQVIEHIKNREGIPDLYPIVNVKKVAACGTPYAKDTLLYDSLENEYERYREEVFYKTINGINYRIVLRRSHMENQHLMLAISLSLAVMLIILFASMYFINRYISVKLWASFFENLAILKKFNLSANNHPIQLQPSEIYEFRELNKVMENLSERMVSEFKLLKEFTENASHELQTPLAVMISKLEMLLQMPGMTDQQAQDLYAVYAAATKLSKLNQNLLLLAKIENDIYHETEAINMQQVINGQLGFLHDFIQTRDLRLKKKLAEQPVIIKANPYLMDTLISNLLNNAVVHNIENGEILILLTNKSLRIENTGNTLDVAPKELFGRFRKAGASQQSPGLGLAIVSQIIKHYHWKVNYDYYDHRHILTVLFG